MSHGSRITSITALQAWSWRGHPALEARVTTEDGSVGVAQVQAGTSVGQHEVQFIHDGGPRWGGLGVQKAVAMVKETIAPALIGMDVTRQREIDYRMLEMDGTPNKAKLGGNCIGAISAAVLKAGAISVNLPLYQYIGGPNACVLPVPGVLAVLGPKRYGGGERGGEKPTYSFYCYGFDSFSDASQGCWQVRQAFRKVLLEKKGLNAQRIDRLFIDQEGVFQHDRELWALMTEAIERSGNTGRIGIQVDVAAGCYYDKKAGLYKGLFSREDKTREELMASLPRRGEAIPIRHHRGPAGRGRFRGTCAIDQGTWNPDFRRRSLHHQPEQAEAGHRDGGGERCPSEGQPGGQPDGGVRHGGPRVPARIRRHAVQQPGRGCGYRRLRGRPQDGAHA